MQHFIVTLDGDGQHNPVYIDPILQPLKDGTADLVIGSRFLNGDHAPSYRMLGITIINWLYNFGAKSKIADSQSGFRAFTKEVAVACPIAEDGFQFSTEFLIKARANGFRIVEVPISCVYQGNGQDHSMNAIKHGLKVALATIKWRLKIEFLHQSYKIEKQNTLWEIRNQENSLRISKK
jgi:glycosyltransferase involved in cell wall biosynthesis